MESVTLTGSGQELYIALSDSNWTTQKNTEAYLACSKTGIMEANIKMALRIVMERDSKNPTPTIDTEPENACYNKYSKHFYFKIHSIVIIGAFFK